jgi:SAM-dependent methyltransferase
MATPLFHDPKDLNDFTQSTIRHYSERADAFWAGTKDHDVSQNYAALLSALPQTRPLAILDLGCGPGRDLKYFQSIGHQPIGLDACPEFCRMARYHTGCEVWQQDFRKLNLPAARFDGVFANASLFHVPRLDLKRVLKELHDALKPEGILFSSNPRGHGEVFDGSRFGFYLEFEEYRDFLKEAGFKVLTHYYRPKNLPFDQQPWLAVVSQRG